MLSEYDKDQLARFIEANHGAAWGARIENLVLLHGGAASATYSFDAAFEELGGRARRGFVLRLQSHAGLMDAEQALEFAAYRSVQGRDIPAPKPVALVEDASVLGAPFMLVERVEEAVAASPFHPNPYGEFGPEMGRDFFTLLGRLAAIDPHETEIAGVVMAPTADECWKRELDYWEQALAIDTLEPQPIAEAAIRRLRRNPPPSPRILSIVHGDLRHGNFLHDGRGRITAVLGWEMTHIGDPIEDLAWALDPIWSLGKPELAAGLIAREEAIKLWESAFGFEFDPERYRWWSLFASVKGIAIWARAAKAFAEGKNPSPMAGFTGWYCATRHNYLVAERLSAATRGGL